MAYIWSVAADDNDALRPLVGALITYLDKALMPIAEGDAAEQVVRGGLQAARKWASGEGELAAIRRMGFDAAECSNEAVLAHRPAIGAAADALNKLSALLELFFEDADRGETIGYVMETIEAATIAVAYQQGQDEGQELGPRRAAELRALAEFLRVLPAPGLGS
jgi:hypothetical protein